MRQVIAIATFLFAMLMLSILNVDPAGAVMGMIFGAGVSSMEQERVRHDPD